jgi:CHAT domain-containing protein
MKRFYEHMSGSTHAGNKASALARAQRELRSTAELAHPYFWAPFMLVGRASRFAGDEAIKVGSST